MNRHDQLTPMNRHAMNRRNFVKAIRVVPLMATVSASDALPIIKPPRLKPGDTVGFICPAAPAYNREELKSIEESMRTLDLKVKYGKTSGIATVISPERIPNEPQMSTPRLPRNQSI
ncbi:MAG: hypothetical protein ACI9V1_001001 [Spirosomataceae bacterium]|jgi:hypothetical protein